MVEVEVGTLDAGHRERPTCPRLQLARSLRTRRIAVLERARDDEDLVTLANQRMRDRPRAEFGSSPQFGRPTVHDEGDPHARPPSNATR